MTSDSPLPPHLERFVRDQLATGHFRSESDLIQTALRLLERQEHSPEATRAWLKQELDKGLESRPAEPVTEAYWDLLRDRVRARTASGDDA
ncbi:MAG TPA: type II toxin-antitoxin system ParD family antitoxin [Urbifossiella sp.]|jgi:antitoxin ParD1/3/4|nr:type II toxin-antitoxin system ParD family antitoxin [Urbifossiella sp.]